MSAMLGHALVNQARVGRLILLEPAPKLYIAHPAPINEIGLDRPASTHANLEEAPVQYRTLQSRTGQSRMLLNHRQLRLSRAWLVFCVEDQLLCTSWSALFRQLWETFRVVFFNKWK